MANLSLVFDLIAKDKASREIRSVGDAAGTSGKQLDGLSKSGVAVGAAIGSLAARGITAGLGAIKDFAAGSVDAFAAVEDATGAAGVQFGDALPQVLKFADEASKSFGLSRRAALDAQNTFGTLGKSAGLAGKPLADFTGQFAGLAGDLASFKGTSTEQAIEAIGAALRGEAEPIRAYGVLLDDATLRQEALALGLVNTTKNALTPQQKVLATQSVLLKQTTDAQGDFAETSDSTANTQKRLSAEMENSSAKLGEKLAPAVTKAREKFIELIDKLSDTEGTFQRKVVPAAQAVIDKLQSMAEFVKRNQDLIVPLTVAVGTFAGAIAAVSAVTKTYTAAQVLLNVALAANPIGAIVLALVAITAGLVTAYQTSDTFRAAVDKAWAKLKELAVTVDDVGRKVDTWVIGKFKAAKDKLDDFVDAMKDFKLPGWVETLGDVVGKIGGGFTAGFRALKDGALGDGPGRVVGGNALKRVQSILPAGAYITSTYRSPAENKRVGGSPTSYHLDRNDPAVDIGGSPAVLDRMYARMRVMGGWRELLWRVKGHFDHIHAAAAGGPVFGPGTGTSDSIPALLSNGEFVINAKSAKALGYGVLSKLNRFAAGGAVGSVDALKSLLGKSLTIFDVNSADVKDSLADLAKLPVEFFKRVIASGQRILVGDRGAGMFGLPGLTGPVRGQPSASWNNVGGVYDPRTKSVVIGDQQKTSSASVAVHELAHAMDEVYGITSRPDLIPRIEILQKALGAMSGGSYYTQVGAAGLSETFAEAVALATEGKLPANLVPVIDEILKKAVGVGLAQTAQRIGKTFVVPEAKVSGAVKDFNAAVEVPYVWSQPANNDGRGSISYVDAAGNSYTGDAGWAAHDRDLLAATNRTNELLERLPANVLLAERVR